MSQFKFTTRSGKQIDIPTVTLSEDETAKLMRLKEDHESRGVHLSLLGVLLDVLGKGNSQVRNQWKNADKSKRNREFTLAITPLMKNPVANAAAIHALGVKFGVIPGTAVDMSEAETEAETEMTEAELEQATAPVTN